MKALQLFSDEALERGMQMSTEEIVRFLDEFRKRYYDSQLLEDPENSKSPENPVT